MSFFIWLFFICGVLLNLLVLARIDVRRLEFLDGVLIGQLYFIIIPLTFFLVAGSTGMFDIDATFRPYEDVGTTGVLIGGSYLLALLRLFVPRARGTIIDGAMIDRSDSRMLPLMAVIFFATALTVFEMTGLSEGGHWQKNLGEAFEGNPLLVVIKYVANFARNAVFALLLHSVMINRLSFRAMIIFGVIIALVDLMTTFNRITAVYLLIAAFLVMRRRPYIMIPAAAGALLLLSSVSVFWPTFRGIATLKGYSIEAMVEAAKIATETTEHASSLDKGLNSVFESSNIVVLNWVVNHAGTHELPTLYGTMFVRAATTFVPSSVWSGRPPNFGLVVGKGMAGIDGLALNSTLYGEAYANFLLLWPLALAVFLLVIHFLFRAIAKDSRSVGFIGAFAAIAMWRFDASFIGVAVILTFALTWALRLLRPKNTAKMAARLDGHASMNIADKSQRLD